MIYKLNMTEMRNMLKEFGKTLYGKTIFVICYSTFIILLIFLLISIIFNLLCFENYLIVSFICLISFLIGSYGYYKELRIFVNKNIK